MKLSQTDPMREPRLADRILRAAFLAAVTLCLADFVVRMSFVWLWKYLSPYEVTIVSQAAAMARGIPYYGNSEVQVSSFIYTHGYFSVLTALFHVFGIKICVVKLLAAACTLALLAGLYSAARKQTGSRNLALLALPLFIATNSYMSNVLCQVRVDIPATLLVLAGFMQLIKFTPRHYFLGMLLLMAAFFFKQTSLVFYAAAIPLFLFFEPGRKTRALASLALALCVFAALIAAFDHIYGPWFLKTVFKSSSLSLIYSRLPEFTRFIAHNAFPFLIIALNRVSVPYDRKKLLLDGFILSGMVLGGVNYLIPGGSLNGYLGAEVFVILAAVSSIGELIATGHLAQHARILMAGTVIHIAGLAPLPDYLSAGAREYQTLQMPALERHIMRRQDKSIYVPDFTFFNALIGKPIFDSSQELVNDYSAFGKLPDRLTNAIARRDFDEIIFLKQINYLDRVPGFMDFLKTHYELCANCGDPALIIYTPKSSAVNQSPQHNRGAPDRAHP